MKHMVPLICCVFHGNHKVHRGRKIPTHPWHAPSSCFNMVLAVCKYLHNCSRSFVDYHCLRIQAFSLSVRVSSWGKDVAQACGSSFLPHFRSRSLSSQFDAIAMMSLVMSKEEFEQIVFSLSWFKRLSLSFFLWWRRLNLIAFSNNFALNVVSV